MDSKVIHRPEVPIWREDAFLGQFCDGLVSHELYSQAVANDQKTPDLKPTLLTYVSAIQHALEVKADAMRLLKPQDFEKLRTVASYIGPIARFEEYTQKGHFLFWMEAINQTFNSWGYGAATFIVPIKYTKGVIAAKGRRESREHVSFLIVEGQGLWSSTADVTLVNSAANEYHPSQVVKSKVKFRSCLHFKGVSARKIKDPSFWFMLYHLRFEQVQYYPDRNAEITLYAVILPWLTGKPLPQAYEAVPANLHGPFETQMKSDLCLLHPIRSIVRFMLMRPGNNAFDEKKVKQVFYAVRLSFLDKVQARLGQDMSSIPGGFQDSDRRVIQEAAKKMVACAGKEVQRGSLSHPDLRQLRQDMEKLAKKASELASPFTSLDKEMKLQASAPLQTWPGFEYEMKLQASAPLQTWPGFEYVLQEPEEEQRLGLLGEKTQAPPQDVFINMQVRTPRDLLELTQELNTCVQRCKRLKGSQANSGSRPGKVPAQQIAAHIEHSVLEEWPMPSLDPADEDKDLWKRAEGKLSHDQQNELCQKIRDLLMEYQDAIWVVNNSSLYARGETLITAGALLAMCDATVRLVPQRGMQVVTELLRKGWVVDTNGPDDKTMSTQTAEVYFYRPSALVARYKVLSYFERVEEGFKNKPKRLFYKKGIKRFERFIWLTKDTVGFLDQIVERMGIPLDEQNGSTMKSLLKWACRDEEGGEPGETSYSSTKELAAPLWAYLRDVHTLYRNLFGDFYYSAPGGS
eukprot:g44174.t1